VEILLSLQAQRGYADAKALNDNRSDLSRSLEVKEPEIIQNDPAINLQRALYFHRLNEMDRRGDPGLFRHT
jgi:hypothetical protein